MNGDIADLSAAGLPNSIGSLQFREKGVGVYWWLNYYIYIILQMILFFFNF